MLGIRKANENDNSSFSLSSQDLVDACPSEKRARVERIVSNPDAHLSHENAHLSHENVHLQFLVHVSPALDMS